MSKRVLFQANGGIMVLSASVASGVAWTLSEQKLLAALWFQGLSIEIITTVLDRSGESIKSRAARLNLPRREHPIRDQAAAAPLIEAAREESHKRVVRHPTQRMKAAKCLTCAEIWCAPLNQQICDRCKSTDAWRYGGVYG